MSLWHPLRPPNHDLSAPMSDGVNAPRWWHHAARAFVSIVLTLILAMKAPWLVAGAVALLVAGVIPHVIGVLSHAYPLDLPDWCADAWISGAGLVVAAFVLDWRAGILALLFYVWGYLRLYPYASP